MRGIIYCSKIETGLKQFKKIIKDYDTIGIKCERPIVSKNQAIADVDNGDRWTVVIAGEGARGNACNVAYIDKTINDNLVKQVIMPTIKACPYQAYRYYNWSNQ